MMPILRSAKAQYEASDAMKAEAEALRLMALAGGAWPALKGAEARGDVSPRVLSVLKAAAPAATSGSGDAVMAPIGFPGFQQALRTSSVFDAVASESVQGSFRAKVGMLAGQITGAKVGEGQAKLGQTMLFASNTITPEKFVSLVAVTDEFLQGAPNAMESLTIALRAAVGAAADLEFLTDIAATNSDPSSGLGTTSLADISADIFQLLSTVDYAQSSSLFLVVGLDHARAMTTAAFAAGINTMSPLGGTFLGLRTLVSDSLPSATISLIDASGIVTASTPITIRASNETSVALADSSSMASGPTATAASLTSMFQTNSTAIVAERSIGFAPLRPNAFASVTSIAWGISTDSPLP